MKQKKVFITGCTRGLGRVMLEGFVKEGWCVAGCARSVASVAHLEREFGGDHMFQVADLADDMSVDRFCKVALEALGAPDLLINNGAVINAPKPLWEMSAAEFSQVMDVNVKGTASMIRAVLPAMIERGSGVIVNFSSGWGRSTSPDVAPYCASKWAIEGLSQALSQELPTGLGAVALNPGIINTDMLRESFGSSSEAYETPEEWGLKAMPLLLGLTARDNGKAMSV